MISAWNLLPYFVGLVFLGYAIVILCRWIYLRHAPQIEGEVRWRELGTTLYNFRKESALTRRDRVLYFLRVRLDPTRSDGRTVQVPTEPTIYDSMTIGDQISIRALPYRPFWLFWSDMVCKLD